MIGSGKAIVTLDMYTSPDKTSKIGTINWGESEDKSIGTYYNHLVLGDGINWGKATSTLETAQCLGVSVAKDVGRY